jgi:thymidylate synthase (FAD)
MRSCRSKKRADEIFYELSDEDIQRLIRAAVKDGQESVLEHAVISFSLGEISRVLTHQMVRHRIASYSQLSGRIIILPDWVKPEDLPQWVIDEATVYTDKLFDLAKRAKDAGCKTESLRYFLPFGIKTNIVWTMNLRECRYVFKLRSKLDAQKEFRDLISQMLVLAKDISPITFEDLQ